MTTNEKLRKSLSEMVVLWDNVTTAFPTLASEPAYMKAKQVLKETEPTDLPNHCISPLHGNLGCKYPDGTCKKCTTP